MGYALFTARKMSLQAKVNDYNAQLMRISNEEDRLTNQTAANQQKTNIATSFAGTLGTIGTIGGAIFGGVGGAQLGGSIGGLLGKGITDGASAKQQIQQNKLAAQQKQLDTEKQRINTLLTKAQKELESVEKAEESAIGSATPKYTA